jgi:hypothetical protein
MFKRVLKVESGVWHMTLVLRKIPKRGYFMSLRQAGVGASLSRNFQNQSCVARLAPGGGPNREMEGCVAGVRQHSGQCPSGVVYVSVFVKKQLKSG